MAEREVILIGLGNFGQKVVSLFNDLMYERKYQLTPEQDTKIVHSIVFPVNQPFNFTKINSDIARLVEKSDARRYSQPFSYIIVGDLAENGTATYAVDYATCPWLFEQANTLRKRDVLGFFTFSDEVGAVESCTPETMALIANFFKKIEKIDHDNYFQAPFTDPNGQPFNKVPCPYGPFDRNYILVTPGGKSAVENETSLVFAERLFYELYYLSDRYENLAASVQADRNDRDGSCFSGFSMIQVSRLDELQHYYLKYILEEQITNFLLADGVKGSESGLEYIQKTFFDMLDIPFKEKDFPIDRAINLFIKLKRNELSNMLNIYESNSNTDVKEYISICKENIDSKLNDLASQYDEFIRNEMDWMLNKTLIEGFKNLFKINNLVGNISTYIQYVELIRDRFASWTGSLKRILAEVSEVSLDEDFEKVEEKIKAIQKSPLYKIPIFIPIRKLLIRNAIYSLPVEKYIRNVIKKNLTQSLIVQWEDSSVNSRNPVKDCNEVISDLLAMKAKIEERRNQAISKKQFIENIPHYYYIISQKDEEDYSALLRKIESINFGTGTKSKIEQLAIDSFKRWTGKAEYLQDITKNLSKFIAHIDAYVENECVNGFGHIDSDTEEFSRYSKDAVRNMNDRARLLCEKSFHTNSSTDYILGDKIILNPLLDNEDFLSREIKQNTTNINSLEIPREFTLGSVIYFQDFMYLNRTSLQKYDNLKPYENVPVQAPIYIQPGSATVAKTKVESKPVTTEPVTSYTISKPTPTVSTPVAPAKPVEVSNEELTLENKYVRSIILDVYTKAMTSSLYNQKFQENYSELTSGQVNRLAKIMSIEEALNNLDDIQLQDYAREIEVRIVADRKQQIELIAYSIKKSR